MLRVYPFRNESEGAGQRCGLELAEHLDDPHEQRARSAAVQSGASAAAAGIDRNAAGATVQCPVRVRVPDR